MWIRAFLLGLSLMVCAALPAGARSGGVGHDDPFNSEHIDVLPSEVRHYIAGICKGPARAQHDFATYLPSERRWRINLEYLQCEGLGAFRRGNQCLDIDFVGNGSHFRLARKSYAECGF